MKQQLPKVSVIIPTHNRSHLISRSIQSVLNQTYQDFEIIIVDDGSTDNTEEIIKEFQEQNKRIRYIRHKENKGGAAARNTGIRAAQGEYVAFQDSDDEWLPEKLDKQMKLFENVSREVGVVYTGVWRIENNKKNYIPFSYITKKEGNIHKELLRGNFVTTQAAIVRKECFKKEEMFDEALPRLQDWELFIRLSKSYKFKCIDEALVVSYFTSNSISANQDALLKAFKLILEKHFQDLLKRRKILAKFHYTIGDLLCKSGKMKEGKEYLLKAIKLNPFNIKFLLVALVSFLGQRVYKKMVKVYQGIQGNNATR